jgi:hypothetical protein
MLFILAFSGIYFVYPNWIRALVHPFSPVIEQHMDNPEGLTSALIPGATSISIEQAVVLAKRALPQAELKQ